MVNESFSLIIVKLQKFEACVHMFTEHNLFSLFQEYSEDSNSEPDVDLENQYYNSKALKEDDPKAALVSFQKVLELEMGEKGEWGFKALKQMIKINFKLVSIVSKINCLWKTIVV